MKESLESPSRRELLRGALAAALAGSVESAQAKQPAENRDSKAEKMFEIKLLLDELREKTEELKSAFAHKDTDPETYARLSKEVGELFEKAKPLIDNLQK